MKIIIVGYGPGGVTAATAARAFDRNAEILLVTGEKLPSHRKPGASLALEYPWTEKLAIPDWSFDNLTRSRIHAISNAKVISGDARKRVIEVQDSEGKTSACSFDKLILATGGIPALPDIPNTNIPGVFTIQTMPDASRLGENLPKMNSVIIIGAGFSALETAERLYRMGKEVHMIVRSRFMRKQLEPEMSNELASRLPKGIHIHQGSAPEAVIGEETASGIRINGKDIIGDAVIFMTGVKPNTSLAEQLGLNIGPLGGVSVDQNMETSVEGIYAAGDCVEMIDPLTQKPFFMPIGSVAARGGKQAGVAAVGGKKVYGDTSLRLQYDRLFDTDIICIGHSSVSASAANLETEVHYIDDPHEFTKIALVTTKDDQVIGGQVLAARLGSRVGYQILERVEKGSKLKEKPLLISRHERIKELLERTLGPIE